MNIYKLFLDLFSYLLCHLLMKYWEVLIDLLDQIKHFGFLSLVCRPAPSTWRTPRSPCPRLYGHFTLAPPTLLQALHQPPPPPPPPSPAPPLHLVLHLPPRLPPVLRVLPTALPTTTTTAATITPAPNFSCPRLPSASSHPLLVPAPAAPVPAGASAAPAAFAVAPARESVAVARRAAVSHEAPALHWMSSQRMPWRWT